VDGLLSEYQRVAGGRINVVRFNTRSDAGANAAVADGMRAFNRDKGDVCYLGLAVTGNGQKELLPQLAPEWEPALESDLSRAIERVGHSKPPTRPATAVASEPDAAALEDVRRAIPNLASLSVEEGTRILRESALSEFKAAASEMEIQTAEAQQRLGRAQNGGSAADQQAALKQLQQLQAEQTEKLRQIAGRLQTRISALEQLKGAAGQPPAAR